MKAPDIPEGFMFGRARQSGNFDITCLHPGCHQSISVAARDDLWARRFIEKHQKLHGGEKCP